jgi:hypothetical protein
MTTYPNANQLRGRAIGTIFFACFGVGWLFMALIAKQQISPATVSGAMLGLVVLLLGAFTLMRAAKAHPRVPSDPAVGRTFAWINAIQWIAVFLVGFSFAKLHIDAYVISAITAIIGLHMFPLARLFRYPMHYVTGSVLVAWSAASAIYLPTDQMQGTTALGTGCILWISAAVNLALAFRAIRQPANPLPC